MKEKNSLIATIVFSAIQIALILLRVFGVINNWFIAYLPLILFFGLLFVICILLIVLIKEHMIIYNNEKDKLEINKEVFNKKE